MALAGNIKTFPLTDLLQWFSISRKSGILSLSTATYYVKLAFRKGVLVSAVSNDPKRRIGQFLIARAYINEENLVAALNRQEEASGGFLLGEILCREGSIDRETLERAVRDRSQEIVFDLFLLDEGSFHFDAEAEPPAGSFEVGMNLDFLVLEGIRRKDEWQRIQERIPSPLNRFHSRSDVEPPRKKLSELDLSLWQMLKEDTLSGDEIVMRTRLSEYDVFSSLFNLIEFECVDLLPQLESAPANPPEPRSHLEYEQEVRTLIATRDFRLAAELLQTARVEGHDIMWLERTAAWIEREERAYLSTKYTPTSVPYLIPDISRIRKEDINPREGFLLSRLGEGMNTKMLCQVMPLSESEILRICHSLEKKGIIGLR